MKSKVCQIVMSSVEEIKQGKEKTSHKVGLIDCVTLNEVVSKGPSKTGEPRNARLSKWQTKGRLGQRMRRSGMERQLGRYRRFRSREE